ncbi:MAG: 3-oxoacyl-[acyl-carrier-protein] synthase III C-terminal domain-containing protein [Bacteroidota bacterium]
MQTQNQIFINHLDYYIPEDRLYFSEQTAYFKDKDQNIDEFLAFTNNTLKLKGVSVENKWSFEDMINQLLEKNLDEGNIIPENINFIVIAPDLGHQLIDFGHNVQYKYKMSNAQVIRISDNYCANIDVAVGLASKLIGKQSEKEQHVLILGGTRLENSLKGRIIANYAIVGDSASLTLMSNHKETAKFRYEDQQVVTQGILGAVDFNKDNTMLHFQSYIKCLEKLLNANTIEKNDIDKIILHNANHYLIELALKSYGISLDKIDKSNHSKYGHLGTSDLVLNLNTCLNNGTQKNQRLVSLSLGIIGTYVATAFKKI